MTSTGTDAVPEAAQVLGQSLATTLLVGSLSRR
jgi:hypothetical protein